jgi:hypothetical protein
VKKIIVICLLASPLLILALAIFHRLSPSNDFGSFPNPVHLSDTQSRWDTNTMVFINTNSDFLNELDQIPIQTIGVELNADNEKSLRRTIRSMVLANYLGDYDAFWYFKAPITNYDVADEIFTGASNLFRQYFPDRPVPDTFAEINRPLWGRDFAGHAYWTSIGIHNLGITVLSTNQIPYFELNELNPHPLSSFGGVRQSYISYDDEIESNLKDAGSLIIAKVSVMVQTIDSNDEKRPFYYVLVFDSEHDVWLPIEMAYLVTKPGKYLPNF